MSIYTCSSCGYRLDYDSLNQEWYCTDCDLNNRSDTYEEEYYQEEWEEIKDSWYDNA